MFNLHFALIRISPFVHQLHHEHFLIDFKDAKLNPLNQLDENLILRSLPIVHQLYHHYEVFNLIAYSRDPLISFTIFLHIVSNQLLILAIEELLSKSI